CLPMVLRVRAFVGSLRGVAGVVRSGRGVLGRLFQSGGGFAGDLGTAFPVPSIKGLREDLHCVERSRFPDTSHFVFDARRHLSVELMTERGVPPTSESGDAVK